jgi:hypothetical protein
MRMKTSLFLGAVAVFLNAVFLNGVFLTGVFLIGFLIGGVSPGWTDEKDSDKAGEKKAGAGSSEKPVSSEKPGRPQVADHLLSAYKNFARTTGYKVRMSVDGGISDNPEHTITNAVVRDTYIGEVYQNTMAVTKSTTFPFQAFRTLKKGVAFVEGMWRPVLAHPAGVRLDRLFPFPSNIMDLAAKYAKSAQWVEDSVDDEDEDEDGDEDETVDGDDEEDAEEDVEDPADKEKDKHKTTPVKKQQDKSKLASIPRVLRVEAPTKEALEHFMLVEKSGCVSGG